MMKASEFVAVAKKAATECKTLYVMGCFGAPMTATNKTRYTSNYTYNKNKSNVINAVTADTFGFDCVCLVKGILWGWNANASKQYGGATYLSNGVPEFGTETMKNHCTSWSKDFSKIEVGEVLYVKGHAGIYIGDGLAVECTPAWKNKVQITAVKNIGTKSGYNARTWTSHGKLKYVDYSKEEVVNEPKDDEHPKQEETVNESITYTVKRGDNLSSIAKKYNTTWKSIYNKNKALIDKDAKRHGVKANYYNFIYAGQVLTIK